MKPAAFGFEAPRGLDGLRTALSSGDAQPMAGNQSLGPLLNLRLTRPGRVVSLAGVAELRRVEEHADRVVLGAGITHAEVEDGEVPDPTPGWMRAAAAGIAHRAVRNRGTLGGSLAHADPAADWPLVLLALGASVTLLGPSGERTLDLDNFLAGAFATALMPGEIITAVTVPRPAAGARWAYMKFSRQVGEFAKASAAVLREPDGRGRVALGALGDRPTLLANAQGLVDGTMAPEASLPEGAGRLHATMLRRALAAVRERDAAS